MCVLLSCPALTEVPSRPTAADARADSPEPPETSPDAVEAGPTAQGTELELTADELSAIRDALARHVGPPAEGPTARPDSVALERVEPGIEPELSVAPVPVDAAPAGPAEPLAEARAETRRLLRRFRPHREEAKTASPVPALRNEGEVAEREPAVPAAEHDGNPGRDRRRRGRGSGARPGEPAGGRRTGGRAIGGG